AALSFIEPTARKSQLLRVQDVNGQALEAIRGTVGEVLAFLDETTRVARDLEAAAARLGRSERGAEDVRRRVDDILRTLGEVSVMTRVARAFVRGELDAERAAR